MSLRFFHLASVQASRRGNPPGTGKP